MDKRTKELIKNTSIIGLGRISTQIISFLLIPLYTKILSTTEYGTFDLYSSIIYLLMPIITFQIELAAYRYMIASRENTVRIKTVFSTSIIFVTICILIYTIFLGLLTPFFPISNCFLLFGYAITSVCFLVANNIVRALGDNLNYTISNFIVSIGTILFNVIALCYLNLRVEGLIFSVILANILGSFYLLISNHLYTYFDHKLFSLKTLKEMLGYSIPLIPNELSWWVIKGSDKLVVTFFLGVSFNGILAMGMKFASIFQSLGNIFIIAWTENVILYYKKDKDSFNPLINQTLVLFGWLAAFIIVLVGLVFKYMVAPEYGESYMLVPLYIVAIYFNCVGGLFGAVYLAEGKTSAVTKTTIMAGIINLFSDILLIKLIGIYAAAISSILGYFAMAAYRIFQMRTIIKFKIEKKYIAWISMGFIVAIIGYVGSMPTKVTTLIIMIVLFFITNYHYINSLFSKKRNR